MKIMILELPMELELKKLGLKEKEVKVYLAGLELGPNSIKNIAEKVKIPRPTVYEIVKKLEEKGLFIETKKGKKRLFVAQSPSQILRFLRIKKREIEEKEREFTRIISILEAKYSREKEGIRIFQGKEGKKAIIEILSLSPTPEILIVNPELNPISQRERKKIYQSIKKRLGQIRVKKTKIPGLNGSLIIFDKVAFFPSKTSKIILLF
jgi:sugar-specific transcriptional regulator TrmB